MIFLQNKVKVDVFVINEFHSGIFVFVGSITVSVFPYKVRIRFVNLRLLNLVSYLIIN